MKRHLRSDTGNKQMANPFYYIAAKQITLFIILRIFCFSFLVNNTYSQSVNDTIIFNALGNYNFNFTWSGYTPLIDRLGRPYVYLATKELGLVTFDISNTMSPIPVDTQTVTTFGNLKVTGVAQDSIYLFVALGDFQGAGQNPGLAIFNVTNPASPVLLDQWDTTSFDNGTATVIWQGDYAYLGAMYNGVLILDVTNKQNIQFVSQIIPDTTFGNNTHEYHARGIYLSGDTLLVADDNGGLRVIDVSDKQNPVETGMYISVPMSAVADPFYNHVFRTGNHAYVAADYCGLEVVDVSNPGNMTGTAWLNPWNCTNQPPPFGSWNGSDGHTNEIAYSPGNNILFFSGGDSEILAIDPSDPSQPRIMGAWGQVNDSVGTWGIDVFGNLAALANIKTFGFPFVSVVGGLQLLNWNLVVSDELNDNLPGFNIFPNPANGKIFIELPLNGKETYRVTVCDVAGRPVLTTTTTGAKTEINMDRHSGGVYFVYLSRERSNAILRKLVSIANY